MRKLLAVIILLASSNSALSCSCGDFRSFEDKVKGTDYIAIVKVTQVLANDKTSGRELPSYKILINEIIRYKGDHLSDLIVSGGHPKFGTITSCDIGIDEKQEWILFVNYHQGVPYAGFCSLSTKYKDEEGFQKYQYRTSNNLKVKLDRHFNLPNPVPPVQNGEHRTYFPNGITELVETYCSGKLYGKAEYFHPNGILYASAYYIDNLLHGKEYVFSRNGSPQAIKNYTYGIKTDTSFQYPYCLYYDEECENELSKPSGIIIYDKDGCEIKRLNYSQGEFQDKYYLVHERTFDLINKTENFTRYYDNGEIQVMGQMQFGRPVGTYREYDRNGKLVKTIEYDKQTNN